MVFRAVVFKLLVWCGAEGYVSGLQDAEACQLDATEIFIADIIVCSTCFGYHYAHHQELKSIIQWLLAVVFGAVVFKLLVWCGAEGYVSGQTGRISQNVSPSLSDAYLYSCASFEQWLKCSGWTRHQKNQLQLSISGLLMPETLNTFKHDSCLQA